MFTAVRSCSNFCLVFYITCGSIKVMSIKHIRLYFRVIEWFINNYLITIWKETLALVFKVYKNSFRQGLCKDDRKTNYYFREIHVIANWGYLFCLNSLSFWNNSVAIQVIVKQLYMYIYEIFLKFLPENRSSFKIWLSFRVFYTQAFFLI
jgi:hypothetical protein